MKHLLKAWPGPFAAVCRGEKRHEYRRNDRNFAVGDELLLQEWDPATGQYTGLEFSCDVTHVTTGGQFGIPEDFCVMSIRSLLERHRAVPRTDCCRLAVESGGKIHVGGCPGDPAAENTQAASFRGWSRAVKMLTPGIRYRDTRIAELERRLATLDAGSAGGMHPCEVHDSESGQPTCLSAATARVHFKGAGSSLLCAEHVKVASDRWPDRTRVEPLLPAPVTPSGTPCPACEGSGFDKRGLGAGYDDVCTDCGGSQQVPTVVAKPEDPKPVCQCDYGHDRDCPVHGDIARCDAIMGEQEADILRLRDALDLANRLLNERTAERDAVTTRAETAERRLLEEEGVADRCNESVERVQNHLFAEIQRHEKLRDTLRARAEKAERDLADLRDSPSMERIQREEACIAATRANERTQRIIQGARVACRTLRMDRAGMGVTLALLTMEAAKIAKARDELKAQLENVLDTSKEGGWMARALDAERDHNDVLAALSEMGAITNTVAFERDTALGRVQSLTAVVDASKSLWAVIDRLHHGRMPDEVQAAMDATETALRAAGYTDLRTRKG